MQDYIEGDLMEMYDRRLKKSGKRKADIQFIIDVMLLFRPAIIRPIKRYKSLNSFGMYKSYFKISWRNLIRNRGYSFINIGGLSLGMTIAIFIGLWIYDELSYNTYHRNYNQIAQVWKGSTNQQTHKIEGNYGLQYPVAATLKNNYSQYFEHVLMAWWLGEDFMLSLGNEKFARKGEFIEEGGLEMLSLDMLSGSYESLHDPHSIVLSESLAKAIFGDADPINKTLRINNKVDVSVTGVYDDIPSNSTFSRAQFFAPWPVLQSLKTWINNKENDWDNHFVNVYVQLHPDVTAEEVNNGIKELYAKNVPEDFYKAIERYQPFVQVIPMRTWHLYSEINNGHPAGGRITFVWLFGIVGAFVLLLACINFVNLSTARSERRAREVGVRKTMGSMKEQLVLQFLSESFMVVLWAFAMSIALLTLFHEEFNQVAGKQIALPFDLPGFWLAAFGFILLTGLLAGLYPAFYLSSYKPTQALKGMMRSSRLNVLPRQVLVVVQFTVSVMLIVGTMVVYKQIQYAQNRPVGYSTQGLLTVSMNDPTYAGKLDVLKYELLNSGAVSEVAASSTAITQINNIVGGFNWQGKDPDLDAEFVNCNVSPEFGKTIGWEIVAGRDFSAGIPADTTSSIIINEAAARFMGMADPIGQELSDVDEFGNVMWTKTIIGVVNDIVMDSPYEPVEPTIFYYNNNVNNQMHIRINPAMRTGESLSRIKTVFDAVVPSALFDYKFVDEAYDRKFSQEERIGKLSGIFTVLAVFISCLGLFGLIAYVAEQRTKEIGIRKVMGASAFIIWKMLSMEFVILVLIACLIAIPTASYFLSEWLTRFEYRATISWWVWLGSAFGAVLITLLTVSAKAMNAARMNPVKSLRSE
jgi:putative ABC transport system permease protein